MPNRNLGARARDALRAVRHTLVDRWSFPLPLTAQLAYAPFLVQMVVTRRCNLSCGYCNEYDKFSAPVPLATLRERLRKVRDLGSLAVEFTGGEPLLHPDIVALVRQATDWRFPARMMISNAVLFDEDRVKALNDAGLTHLQISVDGVRPNRVTQKTLDPLRRTLEVVAKHAAFTVQLSAVIGASDPAETLEMIDFAVAHGFLPRVLLVHGHDGQVKLQPAELAAYEEAKRRMGRRFSESHGYREKLIEEGCAPFRCRAGARYIYLDEQGIAHWCSQQRAAFAKPILEYTAADLAEQFHTPKGCNPGCTVGCARTSSAWDEWRRQGPADGAPAAE
jgi:MoaA/NifB/PqqE/SkfB family radical SAM enzyme